MKLGLRARDKITGFDGIITGKASYITGCDQYFIQPRSWSGGYIEGRWIDEGRIEVIGEGIAIEEVNVDLTAAIFQHQ